MEIRTSLEWGALIREAGKTRVHNGVYRGQPVVIKHLVSDESIWIRSFKNEVDVYRSRINGLPHPKYLASGSNILVVSKIDGRPLSNERYPTSELAQDSLTFILGYCETLSEIKKIKVGKLYKFDYIERLNRYRALGHLVEGDVTFIQSMCGYKQLTYEINHGDLILSNILQSSYGKFGVVDFEFFGHYLPNYDYALLDTMLMFNDDLRRCIRSIPKSDLDWRMFYLNKLMILAREIKIHEALDKAPECIVTALKDDLCKTRGKLH